MVSLVLVSHSRALAEALVPLIREMAADEIAIAIAAGSGDDGASFGTDAVAIMQAIESVDSEDGVLVLGDMGSALLSTDMAIDLLSEELRARTRLLSAPFVEGALAAAVQASMGSPVDVVAREAQQALLQKQQHVGDAEDPLSSLPATASLETEKPSDEAPAQSVEVELTNPHGLHARPAAQLVRTATQFDAAITIRHLSGSHDPVSATSISSVSTLGATQGDRIQLTARGPDADEALHALQTLIQNHFGDELPATDLSDTEPQTEALAASGASPDAGAVAGIPIQAGTAVAPAARFDTSLPDLPETTDAPPNATWEMLQIMLNSVQSDLQVEAQDGSNDLSGILDAQALLLDDDALLDEARRLILEEEQPAARAWMNATETLAARYESLDNEYLQARADDVRDVGRRVILELIDDTANVLSLPETPCILIADALPPSVVSHLDPEWVRGVVCVGGSPTAHNAILLRGQGIPAVFGVGAALQHVEEGAILGIDGAAGHVWIDPSDEQIEQLETKRQRREKAAAAHLEEAQRPATTTDGTHITVTANVSEPADAEQGAERGAEGVGLLRTEFLFGDTDDPPTEDEQVAALQAVAAPFGNHPITVRALDAGGDKPLPYLSFPNERNPFLGVRGIRVLLRHPDLFKTQLRAVLRVRAKHNVRLMLPMISTLDEVKQTRDLLNAARTTLNEAGTPYGDDLPVGIMVETPASALSIAQLAPHVDFFSIGTNDLVQYVMATDREHTALTHLSNVLHPPVLRLIQQVVEAAEECPVSVCGEAAANPLALPILIGLGIRHVSVRPEALPATKALIRALSGADAHALAKQALAKSSADAVQDIARGALPEAFVPNAA